MPGSSYTKLKDSWLEFTVLVKRVFGDQEFDIPMCGLCGNTGTIDTTNSAKSPAGVSCGGKFFCVCPNGRARKKRKQGSKYGGTSKV